MTDDIYLLVVARFTPVLKYARVCTSETGMPEFFGMSHSVVNRAAHEISPKYAAAVPCRVPRSERWVINLIALLLKVRNYLVLLIPEELESPIVEKVVIDPVSFSESHEAMENDGRVFVCHKYLSFKKIILLNYSVCVHKNTYGITTEKSVSELGKFTK